MVHIRQSKHKKRPLRTCFATHYKRSTANTLKLQTRRYGFLTGRYAEAKSAVKASRPCFSRGCIKKNGAISKKACIHTMRHSYATHLLEMGLDIVSLKKPTGPMPTSPPTMMYLHIARSDPQGPVLPPWKKLYGGAHPITPWAGVIRQFLPALMKDRGVSTDQLKVLRALAACPYPPGMGGFCHGLQRLRIGTLRAAQFAATAIVRIARASIKNCGWKARKQELLPVKYFHVVFTVPHELLELFRFNREVMYNLLFEKSWETLCLFAP